MVRLAQREVRVVWCVASGARCAARQACGAACGAWRVERGVRRACGASVGPPPRTAEPGFLPECSCRETLPAALASPLASSSPSSSSPSSVPRTLTLQPVAFTHPPPHPPADPLSRLPTHPPTRSPTGAPARPPTDPRTQRPTRPPNHQTIHPPSSRADARAGSGRQNSLFFLHMISICDLHLCFQYVSNCFLLCFLLLFICCVVSDFPPPVLKFRPLSRPARGAAHIGVGEIFSGGD